MYLKTTLPVCGLILMVIACGPRRSSHANETDSTSAAKSDTLPGIWQDTVADDNKAQEPDRENAPELTEATRELLLAKFIDTVTSKHQQLDSVRSGPTAHDINFVVEAFYHAAGKPEAALYLLEISNGPASAFKGSPRYIGKHDGTPGSVQTPGDFYYYLMTLKRENNIAALAQCIRTSGYETSISDGSGDDVYSAAKTIKRDSISFDNLGFEFDLYQVNFTFMLNIDDAFDADGAGAFGYWGGGFYNTVYLKKESDRVYLESYRFDGH